MRMRMHMHAQAQAMSIHGHMAHTPSNQDVPPEVLPLRKERNSQQGVKVESLNQQPEEACHDAVLEENHHGLAAHLWGQNETQLKLQVVLMGLIPLVATSRPPTPANSLRWPLTKRRGGLSTSFCWAQPE